MTSAAKQLVPDPTVYPETDHMGEGELQLLMIELLRPMLARFLAERGVVAHVGANQFIYWVQFVPTRSIAPDIYVLPGIPQSRVEKVWKLWEEAVVPSFCLEIVSNDFEKDYVQIPRACDAIGVSEVIVFDPEPGTGSDRVTWQVFRRTKKSGHLEQVVRTDRDTVRSEQLGCWLTVVGHGGEQRIRIAHDAGGRDIYPTDAETTKAARDAEKAARDAEKAARDAEKAARDAEKAARAALRIEATAREALEAEVTKLRAEAAGAVKPRKPRGR